MTKLEWNKVGERFYESGVDRGVLFVDGAPAGIPWNGLTGLSQRPVSGEVVPKYIDGVKVQEEALTEEFQATLEAFTYPPAFSECDGNVTDTLSKVMLGTQPRKGFAISYRTRIGNDLMGLDYGYQIHIIYGASAMPSPKSIRTLSNQTDVSKLSWDLNTLPIAVNGYLPVSHLVLDSTKLYERVMSTIEQLIYGTEVSNSQLPTPQQIIDIVSAYHPVVLYPSNMLYNSMISSDITGASLSLTTGTSRVFVNTEEYQYHRYNLPVGYSRTAGSDFWQLGLNSWGGQTISAASTVLPNTEYTFALKVRSSVSVAVKLQPQSINGAGAGTAAAILAGGQSTVVDGYFQQLFVTFRTPASGMPAVRFDLDVGSTNMLYPDGGTFDVTEAIMVKGVELPPIQPLSNFYVHEILGVRDPRLPGDLIEVSPGLYQRSVSTRLIEQAVSGIYKLEG